jgi:hypothetical protein
MIKDVEIYSYVFSSSRSHRFKSTAEALTAVRRWHAREMADDHKED